MTVFLHHLHYYSFLKTLRSINSLLRRFIFIPWNYPRRFRDSSFIVDFGYISFMMSASLADLEFWKDHIFRCNTMRWLAQYHLGNNVKLLAYIFDWDTSNNYSILFYFICIFYRIDPNLTDINWYSAVERKQRPTEMESIGLQRYWTLNLFLWDYDSNWYIFM